MYTCNFPTSLRVWFFSLKLLTCLLGVLRPGSSNTGFFPLHPGQGLKILDYFLVLFLCYRFSLVEKPTGFSASISATFSIWMGFHHLNTELPSAMLLSPICCHKWQFLFSNVITACFFTLFLERIALHWHGFLGKCACFWQCPVLSDQESMGAATVSQKVTGPLS